MAFDHFIMGGIALMDNLLQVTQDTKHLGICCIELCVVGIHGPHLKNEWVMGCPRSRVKGGRSPAERTLEARDREVRWPMAGCGALSHPAMEAIADVE
jgi:hypothetical protein